MEKIYSLSGYDSWNYQQKFYLSKDEQKLIDIKLTLTDAEIIEHNYNDEYTYNEIIIWFLNISNNSKVEILQ